MAEEKRAPPKSTIKIQAWDGDWQMSEDLVIKVDLGMSVTNFIKYIEKIRNVSAHRIRVRLTNGNLVPYDRMQWALRRHGIQNESTVRIEPTRPGAWQWYDEEYYEKKVCTEVMDILLKRNGEAMFIDDLRKLVDYPPCYKTSFRVFLRRFPDQFRLRSDITTYKIYVAINEGFQLLSYERIPQQLGKIKQYVAPPEEYWTEFSDVDSINPVESELILPTLNYEVGILNGIGFGCADELKNTNPFVVVLIDGKFVGYSPPRHATRDPVFDQAKFLIPFPYNTNFRKSYSLRFEVWNVNMTKHEVNCRQYCEISGDDLSEFFEPTLLSDYYKTYSLISTAAEEERRIAEEKRLEEAEAAFLQKEIMLMELEDERKEFLDKLFEADRLKAEEEKATEEELYGKKDQDAMDNILENMDDDDDDDMYGFGAKKRIKKSPEQKAYDLACMKASHLNGHIHVRGSKAIFQLQVRGCYELFSLDSQDSCNVNPFVVVVWNGMDVGDTEKRLLTRWPSWENAVFDIPCPGNMEVNQCLLEVQVWNRNTGLDKYMMSSVTLAARPLKEFILHDVNYANRKSFELKIPDEEIIDDEGEVTKIKSKEKGGFVSLLVGPIGLPEKNLRHYQIEIVVGGAMARAEVYCVLFWNSVSFGRTENAPSVTTRISKNTEKVTWSWKNNKFYFSMTEKEKMTKGELKIDCYDPTTKGINSYFGSIIVEKEELTDFLNQEHAQLRSYTLRKDPKRNDKEQKINRGTLTLIGGELGSCLETDRMIGIRSCRSLLRESEVLENEKDRPMCYVDAYWINSGKPELCGRTKPKPNDTSPFWEPSEDGWAIAKDCKPSGLYYANIVLKFEVWEGLPEQPDEEKTLLGVCSITQNELQDFVQSNLYKEMELELEAPSASKIKIKSKLKKKPQTTRIGGYLIISTPGVRVRNSCLHVKEQEEKLKEYLDTYVGRKGAENLFEWSNREKHKGK